MNKLNFTSKKFKQRFLSINNSIESFFNKIKFFKSNFKKNEIIKNNRVFFGVAAVVILTLSYFLIPTIYDKNTIQAKIENHISKKYKFNVKFNEKVRYALLPKPHFVVKNLSILKDKKEIGVVKNFQTFIGLGNYFLIDDLELKNLSLTNADFNITSEEFVFFEEFLKTEPNENEIILKKSNIFFKDIDEDLLFLNKILNGKFYYDSTNLENVLASKNRIFNIPYKLNIKNNKYRKELFINFNSKKIRLNIDSTTNYSDKMKKGVIELLFVNKKKSLNYEIDEKSLNFSSEDKKTLKGSLDFKPFYLKSNLRYEGINIKDLFKDDSLLVEIIKSEILNNQNLNVNINLTVNDITNIDELNEVMRIHHTGQMTLCEPSTQGHTPSTNYRIRVSGGTVQSGGIDLLQHPVSGYHGVYHTGVRHYAWNHLGKANRHAHMIHTRYHCEKVWTKTFANGVTNQQARIHFPDYSIGVRLR